MDKYAVIEDTKVINIIKWDGKSDLQIPNLVKIVGVVDIGYHYVDGQFLKQLP
jgi:hypothetical protein